MKYFINPSGGEMAGPFEKEEVKRLVEKGKYKSTDIIRSEDNREVLSAGHFISKYWPVDPNDTAFGTYKPPAPSPGPGTQAYTYVPDQPAPPPPNVYAAPQATVPGSGAANSGSIPNNLIWAVLSTMFCCLPLGVVAIIFASQVNTKIAAGDFDGARQASKNALTWSIVSTAAGVAVMALYGMLIAVGAMSEP